MTPRHRNQRSHRNQRTLSCLLCFATAALGTAAAPTSTSPAHRSAHVVVTTTMLGVAVSDLAADWCKVLALIPPQGCPGHFDLTPRMLSELRSASLVLRHSYQEDLDERLRSGRNAGDRVVVIATEGTETLPSVYLALCRDVADALVRAFPDRTTEVESRLALVVKRIEVIGAREQARAKAKLAGLPLLVASYQSDLVSWMGASVVATFDRGEDMSLRQVKGLVEQSKREGVVGVIGNLQWGDREVRSLAEALGVPGITLSNYPESTKAGAWDRLLAANVDEMMVLVGDE